MSHLEDLIASVETRYADPTVEFEGGKNAKNLHAQQRRIVITRTDGILRMSSAPGRAQQGIPITGVGTQTVQRFERFETFEAKLTAASQDDLDDMFDRLVNTIFEVCGPNAFEAQNPYEWFQGDSKAGGDWQRRNPGLTLRFRVRLRSRATPAPFAVLAIANADGLLKDVTGATGPTADFIPIENT
jgi:hypothetical protein